ncbi:hypothetical protein [Massilia sp. PAMC28688]|uniref:hypothetical protein n=1 Tax=Massilia sp. PAMC28688 TaxID=2861283 RepID=UPI001E4C445B|nr:hypothetical protein [Massilia sp. PAMC28688]
MSDIIDPPCAAPAAPDVTAEQRMNSQCFCVSLDQDELRLALASELHSPSLLALLEERCPSLFSSMPVFISAAHRARMESIVSAIESVVAMPAYRELVLGQSAPIARHRQGGARSAFFGYDFHLNGDQIGLIEINTNAGGALLNALVARAHRACSVNAQQLASGAGAGPAFEQRIVDMFRHEWALAGHTRPLRTIAIVDLAPAEQYMYPEFILFQRLFERHGIGAVVADPAALHLRDGVLWHGELAIDLVYNRLTDFTLAEPAHAHLRQAYLEDLAVITPHPQAHALYADKRNLVLLSDPDVLARLGVPADIRAVLADSVLRTTLVTADDAERLWKERKSLFFKPAAGFGGRAAYRGDKVTTRVWSDIIAGGYVAQELMQPGARVAGSRDKPQTLKFDLRVYAYDGQSQWLAARLYQGQTTNFRTPGGGFAPVYSLPADAQACAGSC